MISELLQKQIGKETEFIFSEEYHESFLNTFFLEVVKEIGYKTINVFVAFTSDFVYVQVQFIEDDGYPFIHEGKIYYDQYNQWCNQVTSEVK